MLTSSGPISEPHNTIGMVIAFASATEGFSKNISVESTYELALKQLIASAKAKKANGLINVSFQNRISASQGCGGPKQVFEVFAWGTAVEIG